jgi:hypothetical protein
MESSAICLLLLRKRKLLFRVIRPKECQSMRLESASCPDVNLTLTFSVSVTFRFLPLFLVSGSSR